MVVGPCVMAMNLILNKFTRLIVVLLTCNRSNNSINGSRKGITIVLYNGSRKGITIVVVVVVVVAAAGQTIWPISSN